MINTILLAAIHLGGKRDAGCHGLAPTSHQKIYGTAAVCRQIGSQPQTEFQKSLVVFLAEDIIQLLSFSIFGNMNIVRMEIHAGSRKFVFGAKLVKFSFAVIQQGCKHAVFARAGGDDVDGLNCPAFHVQTVQGLGNNLRV